MTFWTRCTTHTKYSKLKETTPEDGRSLLDRNLIPLLTFNTIFSFFYVRNHYLFAVSLLHVLTFISTNSLSRLLIVLLCSYDVMWTLYFPNNISSLSARDILVVSFRFYIQASFLLFRSPLKCSPYRMFNPFYSRHSYSFKLPIHMWGIHCHIG